MRVKSCNLDCLFVFLLLLFSFSFPFLSFLFPSIAADADRSHVAGSSPLIGSKGRHYDRKFQTSAVAVAKGDEVGVPQKKRRNILPITPHEKVYNLPNILTFSRLFSAPVIGYLVLHDQYAASMGLFVVAGLTDWVDGFVARRWNLQTVVGSVIDPMADKTLMTILTVTLAMQGLLPGRASLFYM